MIHISKLERKLNLVRRELGLIGGSLKVIPIKKKNYSIEAAISFKNFHIEFKIDPNTDESWQNYSAIMDYSKQAGINNLVEEVCKKIIMHEVWHWKNDSIFGEIGCPIDLFHRAQMIDSVYSALERKGILKNIPDNESKNVLAAQVCNAFEDIVVNTNLAYEGLSDGLAVVYYDYGKANNGFQNFIEGFLKMQMHLWGKKHDQELIERFYTTDNPMAQKIDGAVNNALNDMGLYNSELPDSISLFRKPAKWNDLSYKMAWHLSELLEDPKNEANGAKPAATKTLIQKLKGLVSAKQGDSEGDSQEQNKEGKDETNAGEQQSPEDGEGEKMDIIPNIAESLDSEITPKEERQLVMAYHANNAGAPRFIPKTRILKLKYESFAKEVEINAKKDVEGFAMPLTPISHEAFSILEHDVQDIDFSKPIFDPESRFPRNLNFEVASDYYYISQPYTKKNERIPNIMFLFDCSGSMDDGSGNNLSGIVKSWREDSKYHYALLGAFGAIKWLKAKKIAPYLKYNVTMFSDTTKTSGWKGYNELEKAQELFFMPEFGGTHIDLNVLEPQLNESSAVILFITDGGIENWTSIKESFRKSINRHMLSYIQIKDKTSTGTDLESWGKPVYHIKAASDLDGLIIDLTKQSFKRHAL